MSRSILRQRIRIVFLMLVCLVALSQPSSATIQAQTGPAATNANGWSFVDVAQVGRDGFTQLNTGRAGPNGAVVVSGVRNGSTGLFLVQDGAVTEVAIDGTVLPAGLGALTQPGTSLSQYAILPDGDVIFSAFVTGGSLNPQFRYTFRWNDSVITLAQPSTEVDPVNQTQAFEHDLQHVTTDGRWLANLTSGTFPNITTDYGLTDGTNRQPIFTFTRTSTNCIGDRILRAAAHAGDVVASYREIQTRTADGDRCTEPVSNAWSVNLAGGASGTLASGQSFINGNTHTGTEISDNSLFLVNNQNQVAAVREIHNAPTTFRVREQLVVFSGGGETIVQDTDGPVDGIFLADFDQEGRVLYSVSLDDNPIATVLLGGPSLETDRVIGPGDALFGQTVTGLAWVARPAAVTGEGRAFAFNYGLDNGVRGIALATQQPPQWNNPNGGDWGTADNWTPAAVPGVDDEARFNLSAEYAVNLGTQQVGDVTIQKGEVTFRNGTLNLSSAGSQLSISTIDSAITPRLTVSGADTTVSAPAVAVGSGGAGELRIESATLNIPEGVEDAVGATLGFAAPATATVTAGGFWLWPEMALGLTHDSLLRVEDGAVAGFGSERLFVGGSVLGLALNNRTGQVVVDNSSNASGQLDLGTLLGPIQELVIGEALIGRLEVTNGGSAIAITTTVGTRDHGATTDAFLTVEGTTATRTALFTSGEQDRGGLFVATGDGTDALVIVSAGGAMSLTQLSLADGAQSNALMFVDGMEADDNGDRRSTVIAPLPATSVAGATGQAATLNPDNGNCVVGRAGRGTLNVSNGALLRCRQLAVGFGSGSRGEMNIDGLLRAVPAVVEVTGPLPEDGAMCIGRVPLCGSGNGNVRGEVILGADGTLLSRIVGIGNGGRLRGSGIVLATDGVVVFDGGSIAPGVVQINAAQRSAHATQQVGTLTIQGNVTISETGVITLNVQGGTPALQDRLVVTGTVNLAGQLALNFSNGYAPKQGDELTLIQATAITGAPTNVVITGLADGFDFDLDAAGGVLVLTANNDGVSTTEGGASTIYLPLVVTAY